MIIHKMSIDVSSENWTLWKDSNRIPTSLPYSAAARKLVRTIHGFENAGHENDGPSKLQDMKLQDMSDMKMKDQYAGHEIAGHEIDGPNL